MNIHRKAKMFLKKMGEHIQICCLRQTQYGTTKESVKCALSLVWISWLSRTCTLMSEAVCESSGNTSRSLELVSGAPGFGSQPFAFHPHAWGTVIC